MTCHEAGAGEFKLVTREEWGAQQPLWVTYLMLPVDHVFFEYTNTDECDTVDDCAQTLRSLQKFNLKLKNNPDIRHNFLISSNGTIYEGRGWDVTPRLPQKWGHVKKWSLYIAFIGNYEANPPNDEMFMSRVELIKYGIMQNYIRRKHLEYSLSN